MSAKGKCLHCGEPALAKGLCRKMYQWERYHIKLEHGTAYFHEYVARTRELSARGEQRLEQLRPMTKPVAVKQARARLTDRDRARIVAVASSAKRRPGDLSALAKRLGVSLGHVCNIAAGRYGDTAAA